jgi:hypothetical protein
MIVTRWFDGFDQDSSGLTNRFSLATLTEMPVDIILIALLKRLVYGGIT